MSIVGEELWDNEYMWKASESAINCVSWCPLKLSLVEKNVTDKNSFIISGGHDKSIKIWTLGDKLDNAELSEECNDIHSDMIRDIKFSPDLLENDYIIATCSEDSTIKILNMNLDCNNKASLVQIVSKNIGSPIWRLAWSPNGRVVSGVFLNQNKGCKGVSYVRKGEDNWEEM